MVSVLSDKWGIFGLHSDGAGREFSHKRALLGIVAFHFFSLKSVRSITISIAFRTDYGMNTMQLAHKYCCTSSFE